MTDNQDKIDKFKMVQDTIPDPSYGLLNKTLDFHEHLRDQGITESIDAILVISKSYKDGIGEATLIELNNDCAKLAAHLVFISTKVGELQGKVAKLDNTKAYIRSKNIIKAKEAASKSGIKMTDGEADHISRVLSEQAYEDMGIIDTSLKYLTNLMFSGRALHETLSSIAHRMLREMSALSAQ